MPASTLCLRSFPPPALARSRADMRKDVQDIFKATPHEKQVMMFSATLNTEMRTVCKKFMQEPHEIFVDDEAKLTLHGLLQYYCKLSEAEKNRKVNDLLDSLEFNQVFLCQLHIISTLFYISFWVKPL